MISSRKVFLTTYLVSYLFYCDVNITVSLFTLHVNMMLVALWAHPTRHWSIKELDSVHAQSCVTLSLQQLAQITQNFKAVITFLFGRKVLEKFWNAEKVASAPKFQIVESVRFGFGNSSRIWPNRFVLLMNLFLSLENGLSRSRKHFVRRHSTSLRSKTYELIKPKNICELSLKVFIFTYWNLLIYSR